MRPRYLTSDLLRQVSSEKSFKGLQGHFLMVKFTPTCPGSWGLEGARETLPRVQSTQGRVVGVGPRYKGPETTQQSVSQPASESPLCARRLAWLSALELGTGRGPLLKELISQWVPAVKEPDVDFRPCSVLGRERSQRWGCCRDRVESKETVLLMGQAQWS